jgi:hypothetical protein
MRIAHRGAIGALALALITLANGCGPAASRDTDGGTEPGSGSGDGSGDGTTPCFRQCSDDGRTVLDCEGDVVAHCDGGLACDPFSTTCVNACEAAEKNQSSVGCDYYATDMDVSRPELCFAAIVANTWSSPAKLQVEYQGRLLPVAQFTRIPSGSGPSLGYAPYDPDLGVPPGEVAILFLSGDSDADPPCPVAPAIPNAGASGTTLGDAFRITSDVPVVAYQINPYGGGSVAVTAASLLIPTSAWDDEYVAVNVSPKDPATQSNTPSLNIIAREDATRVTLVPRAAVTGGPGIPAGAAGAPLTFTLDKGQHAQLSQTAELTGSIVTADKPIGLMAGQRCMNMPVGTSYCDHGEQMIPPVRALGHRHVGVMYRPRVPTETKTYWRIIGTVDDTQLTWSTNVGGPQTLRRGESLTFETGTPFLVESQDENHPFLLFTYMTGSRHVQNGYGDPDFVLSVPPEQYLESYVFFTDPTYPETHLVVVRQRHDGQFHDVTLDCAGTLTGWQPVGTDFEYARVTLTTGNFQNVGACSTGRHEITSTAPFGLWVWGWGTPLTTTFTAHVSYGYPGGMNVRPINNVILKRGRSSDLPISGTEP